MNVNELLYPMRLVDWVSRLNGCERVVLGDSEQGMYRIPEDMLVELLELAGAVKMNKNEQMNALGGAADSHGVYMDENQEIDEVIPKVIIEDVVKNGTNVLKAISGHKNLSLKEIAERYGGSSAAANIANFLARPNDELQNMRPGTIRRIAAALEVDPEWITELLEMVKRDDL